jgi:DsbC/DsbD-like thiol-disulfide interchange protein
MKCRLLLGLLLLGLCPGGTPLAAAGADATAGGHVRLDLLADTAAVVAGRAFTVGVRCRVEPGWHIYWKNPGDAGLPTDVRLAVPPGFTVSPEPWPLPIRFMQGPEIVGYGYEGDVTFLFRVTPPAALAGVARIRLEADCAWLACRNVCVRGQGQASLSLPVSPAAAPANTAFFKAFRNNLPVPAGQPGAPARARVEGAIPPGGAGGQFRVDLTWTRPVTAVEWFPGPAPALEISDGGAETRDGASRIRFTARPLTGQTVPAAPFEIVVAAIDPAGRRVGVTVAVPLRTAGTPADTRRR